MVEVFMLRKFAVLLLLVLPLSGVAVGQDIVFNMTGELALRAPTDAIPGPDVNGYDQATFEFEAVFEQGTEAFSASLGGPLVFQAETVTLTITGAADGSNGTFAPTAPVLFRPRDGDFGRALDAGFAPVLFGETEIALRVSSGVVVDGVRPVGGLLEPAGLPTPGVIAIDQFGAPDPSPIIFSDFANDFNATMQSDYGAVDLVITVTDGLQVTHGDVNMDGVLDFLDISPFITVLATGGFQAEADCDGNGVVDFLDISPFITALSGS